MEIRVRSAVEARPLMLSGWADAIVSTVDNEEMAVPALPHVTRVLTLVFDDVTTDLHGRTVTQAQLTELVSFARSLDDSAHVLVHCRGGIGRSPACAIGIWVARGETPADAIHRVLADRPQAQPNPLVVLTLDEALGAGGRLWNTYHEWAFRQTWWTSGLKPDRSRSATATLLGLSTQTHRTRPKRTR